MFFGIRKLLYGEQYQNVIDWTISIKNLYFVALQFIRKLLLVNNQKNQNLYFFPSKKLFVTLAITVSTQFVHIVC